MSTRRARIKAITSLPVRRKNVENCSKTKQPVKECINTTPRSPRTPRRAVQSDEEDKKSPVTKPASPGLKISEESSDVTNASVIEDSRLLEVKVSIVDSPNGVKTPQRAAKVSVITPNLNYKPNVSNPSSASPNAAVVSPIVSSPKPPSKCTGVIVQRPATPAKGRTPAAHTIDENNELHITSLNVNSVHHNSVASKSVVSDDYNVPSVPESVENDGVMDGIVPLQAETNGPKPIHLLKNEIISENAEVLFDPIIPLPSPSKVRPKLRPTPRLGSLRRSSIQGSASESEDESRRAHLGGAATPGLGRQRRDSHTSLSTSLIVPNRDTGRTRNDSVCSSASQFAGATAATSPTKEKQSTKNRRREVSRRMAAVRRRRESLKREDLTMYDLIFYNPTSNPIAPNQDEIKAKEETIKDELEKKKEEKKKEENPVEPPPADAAPVPQIKLGPNGEIVIDKSSLVINQTDAKRDVSTVREGSWGGGNGKYTRAARTADWSAGETVRFYRALAAIGTDFSLMAPLFPDRTRRELKFKFKKEEKINGAQVDKALRMGNSWDPNRLKEEFQDERETAARKAKREAEKLKEERMKEKERLKRSRELRVRNSRASKALQSTMLPGVSNRKFGDLDTVDDIVNRALLKKSKNIEVPEGMATQIGDKMATISRVNTPGTARPLNLSLTNVPSNIETGSQVALTANDPPATEVPTTPTMATLTLINNGQMIHGQTQIGDNMATISRVKTPVTAPPLNLNALPNVPSNIETGSLVVLTVNDPSSPSKKMLQTYIAHSAGRLTPVALPATFLNSVVGYMKKGTPKSTVSSSSSPQLMSPCSVSSQDSRTGVATPLTNLNPSPIKRKRISSFTMTQL